MRKYLLVTHINPDYDGLSSIIGFIQNILKNEKVSLWKKDFKCQDELIIFLPENLPENQKWIVDGYKLTDIVDYSFDGVLVFDSIPEASRLGMNEKVFHFYLKNNKVLSIDHHPYKKLPNRIEYLLPSTSCCLIKEGIIEDILYLGIWSDTFNLQNRLKESLLYINKLIDNGLGDEKILFFNKMSEPIRPLEMYFDLRDNIKTEYYTSNGTIFLWVKIKERLKHKNSFEDIVNYFKHYCDVLMVSDQFSKRISFRSRNKKHDVSAIARKIGGNGHYFSAGASLKEISDHNIRNIFGSLGYSGMLKANINN